MSALGGSVERTSSPAAPIFPELRASAKSRSFMSPPLPVFIIHAPFFILDMFEAFIISFVESLSTQFSDITSEMRMENGVITYAVVHGGMLGDMEVPDAVGSETEMMVMEWETW